MNRRRRDSLKALILLPFAGFIAFTANVASSPSLPPTAYALWVFALIVAAMICRYLFKALRPIRPWRARLQHHTGRWPSEIAAVLSVGVELVRQLNVAKIELFQPRREAQQGQPVSLHGKARLLTAPFETETPDKYSWLNRLLWTAQLQIEGISNAEALRMRVDSLHEATQPNAHRDKLCARFADPIIVRTHVEFAKRLVAFPTHPSDRTDEDIRQLAELLLRPMSQPTPAQWEADLKSHLEQMLGYQERLLWFLIRRQIPVEDVAALLGLDPTTTRLILTNLENFFDSVDAKVNHLRSRVQATAPGNIARNAISYACESWALGQ